MMVDFTLLDQRIADSVRSVITRSCESHPGGAAMRYSKAVLAGLMIVFLAGLGAALPQHTKYPSRYVTVLVPFTVGTAAEILARQYATKLSERMQHPFVVENRPGGGGVVAAQTLLNTRADGYTLMFVSSAFAINPAIYSNLSFDISRDFSGIALVGDSPVVLVVNPSLGVRNQEEFIALARQRPGELNFGSAGIGSATYFGCEYFDTEARLKIVSVPFRGSRSFWQKYWAAELSLVARQCRSHCHRSEQAS
jgi:tripartite-type tricarboxylate transporter receptor subunit TctC